MSGELTAELLAIAKDLGAANAGVTTSDPFVESLDSLNAARAEGRAGPLRFTHADPVVATDISRSYPWARSILSVAWDYLPDSHDGSETGAKIARFATANHYESLGAITSALTRHLNTAGFTTAILIDDNRLVDRAAGARSGVAWLGKNTMALTPGHGPWTLLGSVVTDAPLSPSAPMRRDCGTCLACLPACPTEALSEAGLDARRCLSTWLQTPGSIPHWIRPVLGRRIYGCDDCLTSCPPGFKALSTAGEAILDLDFSGLLSQSDENLLERFSWWYVPRRDGRFVRRNLLVAAGNSGESAAVQPITDHLNHPSSLIRGHAYWALARLLGKEAEPLLKEAFHRETVVEAMDEVALAHMASSGHPEALRLTLVADQWARETNSIEGLLLLGSDGPSPKLTLVSREHQNPPFACEVLDPDRPDAQNPGRIASSVIVYDRTDSTALLRRRSRALTSG
jgi:epoxyqueuosine reductase